uniref:Uncharacterized protein n=1 Tax=Daphnia galeata TaxID=27404 RepID=A0A8J2RW92_9CRUS|nr:unnamed protein product [Daphnia galeata]
MRNVSIGVKRLKKQLRKAKTRTTPEYSDAEDLDIECNTLESNSNKKNSFESEEEDFESECNISKSYKRIRPDECSSDSKGEVQKSLNRANSYENTKPAGKSSVDDLQNLHKATLVERDIF